MCVAMLIGFRPSQPPAEAPLCRGFRAAVRVPVPPSAVRPRAGGAPRPRLGLQLTSVGTGFQCLGFWGLTLYGFRVLGFGFSGCTHVRDAPMSGIYTLLFYWDLHFRLGLVSLSV